ncbi:MAG TPA: hypothetical protein V6C65_13465, partial [Allocoleopsis sp.]
MDLEPTTAQPDRPQDELVWILNQVDEAIALFAPDHRLTFFNPELVRLWQLDPNWLQTKPDCNQLIQRLAQQDHYPTAQLERLHQALTRPGIGKLDFELEQTNGIGYKAHISLSPEGKRLLCLRLLNPSLSAEAIA